MTYNRNQARPLLTKGEYDLFALSLDDHVHELDRKELKRTIDRTRRARDKYRDLAKRQTIATKKRKGSRGAALGANERTKAKATIFAEALGRLEKRSDKLDAADVRTAKRQVLDQRKLDQEEKVPAAKAKRAPRPAKSDGPGGKGRKRFMSSSAQASDKAAIRAPQTRIAASRGAAGRRKQARRDR